MCGFAGFVDTRALTRPGDLSALAEQMATTLTHRGPDDGGVWVDPPHGVALGHRRLSILDLSPEGHQPMLSAGHRYAIAYNGEIYNFQALRAELEAEGRSPQWRGHSDTEVLLAALEAWGLQRTLERTDGMFAFAAWDRKERRLLLARDRAGEKPLYYGWCGPVLLFASEVGALRRHPAFHGRIDRGALALFLRHAYVPCPWSIYEGIRKLPPGTSLTLDPSRAGVLDPPRPYWSARRVAEQGLAEPFDGSEDDAVQALDLLLRDAVAERMVADVPLGAFLSGGIDSTTVVAHMAAHAARPVRTFTIGFHEASFNEAPYARDVARHLGTDHTELYVTPQQALDVVPRLPGIYDEPFADASQVPTHLVSVLARRHVTVSLSGDGGDELFAGYTRYARARFGRATASAVPRPLRRTLGRALAAVPLRAWDALCRPAAPALGRAFPGTDVPLRLRQGLQFLGGAEEPLLYRGVMSLWPDPARVVLDGREHPTLLTAPRSEGPRGASFEDWMLWADLVTYLPDYILVKVDRASMAVSLESRAPMLDPALMAFAWSLPPHFKRRDGKGKWLLRQALYRYVPPELVERPKQGFGVPVGLWIKGPLRAWAEDLLAPERIRADGFLNPRPIRRAWSEHLSGRHDWSLRLWTVLMWQAWRAAT